MKYVLCLFSYVLDGDTNIESMMMILAMAIVTKMMMMAMIIRGSGSDIPTRNVELRAPLVQPSTHFMMMSPRAMERS